MKKRLALTLLAAVLLGRPAALRADTPALSFTGGTRLFLTNGTTFGYAFTLASARQVTQLGMYDYGSDGLSGAFNLTIYNAAGTSVTTGTVPAGTAGQLVDGFRYVSLAAPVTLTAGTTYTIQANFTGQNDYAFVDATIATAPGVTYVGARLAAGSGYTTSNGAGYGNGYFGPNFQFVVPEPSTWALLALGTGALGLALRRRSVARA